MQRFYYVVVTALVFPLLSTICQKSLAQSPQGGQARPGYSQPRSANTAQAATSISKEQAARIEANLSKLSREDRALVDAQGNCPVMVKNRLGVMGPPVKVMIKGQPVFLCCKGCATKALANPDATLARVEELKAKVAEVEINASLAKLSPEDRRAAEAQGFCPIMTDNRLGAMGPPVKILIGNQPVFLCCKGCRTRALANAEQTLTTVGELKAKVAQTAARKATVGVNPTQR